MDKIIKEIKNKNLIYKISYEDVSKKICLDIFKGEMCIGYSYYSSAQDYFYFATYNYKNNLVNGVINGKVNTIEELFNALKNAVGTPDEVKQEYENLFILYKLNNFNENGIDTL